MAVSRQFRAMRKIAALFAGAWGAVGLAVGTLRGLGLGADALLPSILTHGIMYGSIGAISGITTALLVARSESGRLIEEVPTWRVAAWGVVGGVVPPVVFSALGLLTGGAVSAVLPILAVGVVGGGIGGAVSGSAFAAAKRAALAEPEEQPSFPLG